MFHFFFFFFQAEDGIRDLTVTGVQTCALPICSGSDPRAAPLQRAVVFGAGKMACGLLGYILRQSGCEVLFVARRPDVVDAINRRAGYRLTMLGKRAERLAIRGCRACSVEDTSLVVDEVARADVVMTGIGSG